MSDEKVVRLPGSGAAIPGEPFEDVVLELERLLEEARGGRTIGLAYVTVRTDGCTGTGWTGAAGTRHTILTGVCVLQHRYVEALRQES